MTLRQIATALGGDVAGREVVAPGPNHSRKDRSLGVILSTRNPDGFVCRSYSGDDWQMCRDHVAQALGLPLWKPGQGERSDTAEDIIGRMAARVRRAEAEKAEAEDRQSRIDYAVRIWNEAEPIVGTLADTYLRSRGLTLRPEMAGALRFHPNGPWGRGCRAPMMVAAMTNFVTGEVTGIHRTGLTETAEKIDRKMLGIAAGTAIMLVPATRKLIAGEGIESCISAIELGLAEGAGVWAMGSATFLGRLPVLADVDHLALLEERDTTSANAVSDTGNRWNRAGKTVSVILPKTGNDLNDSLRWIAP